MHPIPSDTVRYSPAFCAFLLRYQVLYKVSDDLHEVPVLTDMGILPVHNILVCCSRLSQQKPYCHPRLSAIFSQRLCDCKVLTYNPPCFAKKNATALAGAEDFPPCFAEQNPSPMARRRFSSLFFEEKSEPYGEERIFLLVFAKKNSVSEDMLLKLHILLETKSILLRGTTLIRILLISFPICQYLKSICSSVRSILT